MSLLCRERDDLPACGAGSRGTAVLRRALLRQLLRLEEPLLVVEPLPVERKALPRMKLRQQLDAVAFQLAHWHPSWGSARSR